VPKKVREETILIKLPQRRASRRLRRLLDLMDILYGTRKDEVAP